MIEGAPFPARMTGQPPAFCAGAGLGGWHGRDRNPDRLGLALAIGFLIGVERGWREREEKEGERAAGLRTFALTGLFGGVWGLLTQEIGPAPMGLAFLALAGAATLFRWRETEREGIVGMTTLVAMFLTFSLGALAVLGDMVAAAAAAVATAALLAAKEWLHGWIRVLTWPELRAALILLAMTFVALPVLPDRGYGPYETLNPYQLWLMTIVIAGVSFIGYVATKVAGERYGSLIAGTAGGLVSSTAVTLDFARRTRAAPHLWRPYLSGGLAASTVMFARVIVVVLLFGPGLAGRWRRHSPWRRLVSAAAALVFNRSFARDEGAIAHEGEPVVRNPFELRTVIGFAALLAAILILTRIVTEYFGGARQHRARGHRRARRRRRDHAVDDAARRRAGGGHRGNRHPRGGRGQFGVEIGAGALGRRTALRPRLCRMHCGGGRGGCRSGGGHSVSLTEGHPAGRGARRAWARRSRRPPARAHGQRRGRRSAFRRSGGGRRG